jgi:hypothetical protein
VVFIAVSSGDAKSEIEGYAKSTSFEWPILVDLARETEKSILGQEISLSNIYQFVVIDPDGRKVAAGPEPARVQQLVEQMLPQAKWFFDGVTVPDKLKPLAKDIELGFYDPAVGDLAAASSKGSKDVQDAAKAMFEKLKPIAEGGLERGKAARDEGKAWSAYREFERVAAWFKKTDYEKTATAALAELRKDKAVKDELAAQQLLAQIRTMLASGKKAEAAQAQGLIQALQKKYPDSEAAREAGKLGK